MAEERKQHPVSADFAWWSNKRGVWPRLNHEEIFRAGWVSCATRLWEVCTTENESKEDFIERIKGIISLPNTQIHNREQMPEQREL